MLFLRFFRCGVFCLLCVLILWSMSGCRKNASLFLNNNTRIEGNFSGRVSGSTLTPFDSFHIQNVSWLRTFMNAKEFQDLAFDSFRVFWRQNGSLKLEVLKIASDPGLTLYVLDVEGRKDAFYMQRIWDAVGKKERFKPVSFEVNERFKKRRVRRSGGGDCAGLPNCAVVAACGGCRQ